MGVYACVDNDSGATVTSSGSGLGSSHDSESIRTRACTYPYVCDFEGWSPTFCLW